MNNEIEKAAKHIESMFDLPADSFEVVLELGYGAYLMKDPMDYYFVADQYEACSIDAELEKCSSYRRVEWKNEKFVAV